jgi:single-strand DNA-binding protein
MYNKLVVIGNLTRDIELKHLPTGAAVANSAIATSHKYKTQSGESKEEVCFLDFDMFGRSAEVAKQYLQKGSKVLLEGRLILHKWVGQDGKNRTKHSLRVDTMKMLNTKDESQALASQNMQNNFTSPVVNQSANKNVEEINPFPEDEIIPF